MRDEVRARLAQVVKLTESTAFDDLLYIPQKQRDQRLFGLAVQFLNEKF